MVGVNSRGESSHPSSEYEYSLFLRSSIRVNEYFLLSLHQPDTRHCDVPWYPWYQASQSHYTQPYSVCSVHN